jgi:hypothetical protein
MEIQLLANSIAEIIESSIDIITFPTIRFLVAGLTFYLFFNKHYGKSQWIALIHRQPGENNEEHDFIMRIFITKDQIVLYQPNDGKKRAYASSFKPGLAHSSLHDRNQISLTSASHLKPSVTILNIFD